MKVIYHGHACFEIRGDDEPKSIIFDPYGSGTGRLKLEVRADLALCTHGHFDHNNCGVAKTCLESFKGEKTIGAAYVKGVEAYHDPQRGSLRGKISIYVLRYGGRIFVHLGDLGHLLSQDQVDEIRSVGRPDILFVPVGGVYTIGPSEALEVIRQIDPRIAVPMHYRHEKLNPRIFSQLHSLDDFLSKWPGEKETLGDNTWDIPVQLPEMTRVLVFSYP